MNKLAEQVTHELRRQANDVPPASGDLERVRRMGRRQLLASRIASFGAVAVVAVVAVAGAMVLREPTDGTRPPASAGQHVFENGYALTPNETATLLVECLQDRGLDVIQNGDAVSFDNRVVATTDFEAARKACETQLRDAGFLLPADNPDYLRVLYAQFETLADCYRSAGIDVPEPPSLEEFINARQAGLPSWSPQTDADQIAGAETARQAERGCALPTPEQIWAED